jgi:AraC-like DNA-binding protein
MNSPAVLWFEKVNNIVLNGERAWIQSSFFVHFICEIIILFLNTWVNEQKRILILHKSEIRKNEVVCLFAQEMHRVSGQTCFMHAHACTEIIWYRGITGWLLQDGQRMAYRDGDIGIYQPVGEHADECKTSGAQICIGINSDDAQTLHAGICRADRETLRVFERVRAELNRHDDWQQKRLNLLASCLVLELCRQQALSTTDGPVIPQAVAKARQIMDTRFAEPLSMSSVAEECRVNADYLRQLFIKWMGQPPMQYLIGKRLAAACDLLRLNQETNAQIAARVGIPNPYYFSRLFRKRMGQTPSAYRARYTR